MRFDRENSSAGILESAYKEWMQGTPQQVPAFYLQQYPNEDVHESMPIRMLGVQSSLGSRPELNEEIDDEEDEFAGYVNSMNTRSQDDVRKRRHENGIASTRNREAERYMGPSAQAEEDDIMMERPHLHESQDSTQTQQPFLCDPGVTGRRNPRLQAARGPLKINDDLMESLYERFHSRTLEIKIGELLHVAPQLKTKLFRELPEKPEDMLQALEV